MATLHEFDVGHSPSRRQFLQVAAASAAAWTLGDLRAADGPHASQSASTAKVTTISEHLSVFHGPINVGIVRDGERALLIDCGDGRVAEALLGLGVKSVAKIAFTHHHRDQACGAYLLAAAGAKIGVPADEQEYFAEPAKYWSHDENHWRVYRSFRPHHLMLTEPLPVDETYTDGAEWSFGPAKIRVLSTPGHTDGSVSYVVEVDGQRVIFSGDCIYDVGQVWEIYSLQKGFEKGGTQIGGYHGFMGDRWRLVESLQHVKQSQPGLLIPSHGRVMSEPAKAIDALAERFEKCYENYVGISALRHYFPALFTDYAGRPNQMPIRPGVKPPDCLRHFGTTWMLLSKSGAAFVMDIGSTGAFQQLKNMLAQGEIKSVDAVWVTHYHFDHTDGIPAFQKEFDSPCITDKRLAEVLVNPQAWRLPCLAPEPIRVHQPMEDGQSWQWHEFKLTSYFYPGQTRYHAALLVEGDGLRMLFVGDSHTMSGIDDYCAQNRNWLGRGVGFQYCLSLIEKLQPTHIYNCHVDPAFTFTADEIRFMRQNLDEREKLFGESVPMDHANYGLDESWVRCFPYSQEAKPGQRLQLQIVITNHSAKPQSASCRAVVPKALGGESTAWVQDTVPEKTEKPLAVELSIPATVAPGRYVIPIDVKFGPWDLPQFAEAIVDVLAG
jgi:glyoxylase-like metal-dependent hydrolase (beta-lactamase superfamily II)